MLVQLNVSMLWNPDGRLSEASHSYANSKRQLVLRGVELALLELDELDQDVVRPMSIADLPASGTIRMAR